MPMNQPRDEQLQRRFLTSLRDHWVLFLVEGIILVVLGMALHARSLDTGPAVPRA